MSVSSEKCRERGAGAGYSLTGLLVMRDAGREGFEAGYSVTGL